MHANLNSSERNDHLALNIF